MDAGFSSTPLKDNKGLRKPDSKKFEALVGTKTLKIPQKAGGREEPKTMRETTVTLEDRQGHGTSEFSVFPEKEQEQWEMKQQSDPELRKAFPRGP